jgi:membrane protease YdiL (CAAX protease family)
MASDAVPDSHPAPESRRGQPLVAWLVILGAVAFVLWRPQSAGGPAQPVDDLLLARMQARAIVGFAKLVPAMSNEVYAQAETLNRGPYRQRLCFVIVAGELKGPEEALRQLERLSANEDITAQPPTEADLELTRLLERLYRAYKAGGKPGGNLSAAERERLRDALGWPGDLALTPASAPADEREAVLDPAVRTASASAVALLVVGGALLLGFCLLLVLTTLTASGKLHRHGEPLGADSGGIYAETFAVWIVLFQALQILADFLPVGQYRLLVKGLMMVASLAALAWPTLRGVPWNRVRREIGLTAGSHPFLEPFFGIVCYLAVLPVLLVVVIVMVRTVGAGLGDALAAQPPIHPMFHVLAKGDPWIWIQILFVAAVVAPIVEETVFRGVLYRHLREATSDRVAPWVSVAVSAVWVSFVFAVIHPQGWVAVPLLMTLALGFCMAREWRGTLLGSMTAHSLNNAFLTLLGIALLT